MSGVVRGASATLRFMYSRASSSLVEEGPTPLKKSQRWKGRQQASRCAKVLV